MLHLLHSAITRWRRASAEPLRLSRPVISVGNIAVGGRAKTPMAALVARALLAAGERPAILSRGYARARVTDAPVVVRDAPGVRGSLAESGDEPLMLAEQLDGAIVVVSADRARAGVVAEQLGATVHILDDGFQHLRVARDIDIVMIEPRDLRDRVMPAGRLREPVEALAHADAIVTIGGAADVDRGNSTGKNFAAERRVSPPPADLAGARAFLVSGIADNEQFAAAVRAAGWHVAGASGFGDHHHYTTDEIESIARQADAAGAAFVLTTAKDAVRLRESWCVDLALHVAELELVLDQPEEFASWLIARVADVRATHAATRLYALRAGPRHAS